MRFHVDGSLVDSEAATLPVDDRGVTFGDAVSEPVRVAGGHPVAWSAHLDRLLDACDALGLDPPDAADLRKRVEETVAANRIEEALVRLTVTRGRNGSDDGEDADHGAGSLPGVARLRPPTDPDPTVVVTVDAVSADPDPVRLGTVRTRAISPAAVPAAAATHNRLDAVLAGAELRRAAPPDGRPADEALLRGADGHVVGGSASDPMFVADDALRLPVLDDHAPRTATRSLVRDIARAEELPVVEGAYAPADFRDADEAFVAEPAAGVRPVGSIDGVDVGGGPVTRLLAHLYDERVVGDAERGV